MRNLIIINTAPQLEEEMVDFLLMHEHLTGFTSFPVRGHGRVHSLTIAEQVAGRQKRLQFEVFIEADHVDVFTDSLVSVGKDILYWVLPVLKSGRTE